MDVVWTSKRRRVLTGIQFKLYINGLYPFGSPTPWDILKKFRTNILLDIPFDIKFPQPTTHPGYLVTATPSGYPHIF